jgi:plasmid stabilization system protein ParE
LGGQLLLEVSRIVADLEQQPDRNPFYYGDFRRLLTNRFPYKVFYRIHGDRVVVFRILHAKRDHRLNL